MAILHERFIIIYLFRYRHEEELPIPISWINDGEVDCVTGKDERHIWPTCNVMETAREVQDNSSCSNVFLCNQGMLQFVELSQLCDGREECGEERSVCQAAQFKDDLFVTALAVKGKFHVSYCLPGLSSVNRLAVACVQEVFTSPDHPVFGAKSSVELLLPNISMSCEHVFGESSVFLNCINRCSKNNCKLSPLIHDSCSKSLTKRIFSLAKKSYITIVRKSFKGYSNQMFLCRNKNCLSYKKVCNLVNDCGDHSDEANCSNNFQCENTKFYIPLTKKCNGVIDCKDSSDECNDQCGKDIIPGKVLKVLAWFLGSASVLFNIIHLWKSASTLGKGNKTAKINRSLKIMIGLGDLLTGLYLLLIGTIDAVFAGSYCKRQLDWLTSPYCAVLGILSTFGASISLFSMTHLSMFRAYNINNKMRVLSEHSKRTNIISIVVIIFISFSIAYVPLLNTFEDFFVNGITYDENVRLFISVTNKETHLNVLRSYFGQISRKALDWSLIRSMTNVMFSNNYGDLRRKKVHFYGNEGVCIFKYFVKISDPQLHFVWINLTIDFTCFLCITVCYSIINRGSRSTNKFSTAMMSIGSDEKALYNRRNQRLQRNITKIIITDFLCWIPFIFTSILHTFEVLDATFLYSYCSIVLLSINSVINPLLYDNYIEETVYQSFRKMKMQVFGMSIQRMSNKTNNRKCHLNTKCYVSTIQPRSTVFNGNNGSISESILSYPLSHYSEHPNE